MRNPPCWQLILALTLLGVAAVGRVAAEELGPNLIRDGGMETWNAVGDGDGGWDFLAVSHKNWKYTRTDTGRILTPSLLSDMLGAEGVLQRVEGDAHAGKYALRLQGQFYLGNAFADAYNTAEGYEYVVRYWVKGTGDTKMWLHVYGEGGPAAEIVAREGTAQPDRWSLVTERLRVTGKGATTIYPRLWAASELLVDDVLVARVLLPEETPHPPVPLDLDVRVALAPAAAQAPVVDGKLDDAAWKNAVPTGGMRWCDDQQTLAPLQPTLRFLHDAAHLYLAVQLPEPGAADLVAALAEKRPAGEAYTADHSVEVFWQPPGSGAYYQQAFSLGGWRYDGKGMESAWQGQWQAAVSATAEGWTLEMATPVSDFGLAGLAEGEEWVFNLCWNRGGNYATWCNVGYMFHSPVYFGTVIMADWPGWAGLCEASWQRQAQDIARRAPALGLAADSRLQRLAQAAARAKGGAAAPRTWEEITRAYGRVQYVNRGYRSLAGEVAYLAMFPQGGR